MKKKIANAVELMCLIISFIILNIKNITVVNHSNEVSAIDCMEKFTLQFVPMCVFYLLCAIMCIVSIISKNKEKDGIIHGVLAIVLFITVNWNLITCISNDDIIVNGFPRTLFEIILFLAVIVAFAKRSPIIVGKKTEQNTIINNVNEATNADELKKYKDLLDSGAISQEEFEEKKKQLLGL